MLALQWERFASKAPSLTVGLSADDLQDAYHGVPNSPSQLNLCVVAIRNPNTKKVEFYISYTHTCLACQRQWLILTAFLS